MQGVLLGSMGKILDRTERRQERIESILLGGQCADFLMRHPKAEKYLIRELARVDAHRKRRLKEYERLQNCQAEWIGFAPTACCGTALAVPIGCNHRLCFLCNGARAEKGRERIRKLFDRLTHPVMLTLTIPNLTHINKRTFSQFRQRWNRLRKMHSGWMLGGMIAFETTYNSQPGCPAPWHVHAHVLIDAAFTLPRCRCPFTTDAGGRRTRRHAHECEFVRFKRCLEFDWFLLTGGRSAGWHSADRDYWYHATFPDTWRDRPGRDEWNLQNRRTVDIRAVTDRKKAAFEVLKYITKASHFAHVPEAVDEFITAVRGSRMLQTFGTWYGVKFDEDVNTWDHLQCKCGQNHFVRDERGGLLRKKIFREGVHMDPETGRWYARAGIFPESPPG